MTRVRRRRHSDRPTAGQSSRSVAPAAPGAGTAVTSTPIRMRFVTAATAAITVHESMASGEGRRKEGDPRRRSRPNPPLPPRQRVQPTNQGQQNRQRSGPRAHISSPSMQPRCLEPANEAGPSSKHCRRAISASTEQRGTLSSRLTRSLTPHPGTSPRETLLRKRCAPSFGSRAFGGTSWRRSERFSGTLPDSGTSGEGGSVALRRQLGERRARTRTAGSAIGAPELMPLGAADVLSV